jgi:hypothetical protein
MCLHGVDKDKFTFTFYVYERSPKQGMQDFIFSAFVNADNKLLLQEVDTKALIYKYVKSQIIYFIIPCVLISISLYVYISLSKGACSLIIHELSETLLYK